ncbi:carbonic anhydrase [Thozetella sp. PMI_491]|nr:carbonic anhydrase [Thozetella sp. PMI_491]
MVATIARLALLASAATPALAFCGAYTHLQARAEEGEVKISTFGYQGAIGPTNWQGLDAANALCATGTRQSPINMVDGQFNMLGSAEVVLTIPDQPEGVEFENLGTTVEAVMEGKGATGVIAGVEYELKQFHFHHPSEHLDNGTSMPLEMHMVFQTADAKIAVVGVYVDVASGAATGVARRRRQSREPEAKIIPGMKIMPTTPMENNGSARSVMLETLLSSVEEIAVPGTKVTSKPLVFSELVNTLKQGSFQIYSGSLTTPPCSEGVSWNVATQKLEIPVTTFEKIRNVVKFNSRFPQSTLGEANALSFASAPVAAAPAAE